MDFRPYYPYEPNWSPEGDFFHPNRASRQDHGGFLGIFNTVLKTLWRDLDVFARESKDPGTGLPLSVRFPLPVYQNKESPWIEATNKLLHDHYTATYWKLALQKLQMERGEKDEPTDPSSSSGHSLPNHKSKVKKRRKKRCRRVTKAATVRCRKRNYRSFGVCEERPVVRTSVRRRRWAVSAGVRTWRKAMRKKRESEIELERQSSGSDPEPASPGTRRSVHFIRRPIVSENFMTVIARNIPYGYLNFHPSTTKFSSMEMSMKGISIALYEIRRQLTFYRKVARNMLLEIIRPETRPPVPDYLKQNFLIFLKDFFSFQGLLRTVAPLRFTRSDKRKLDVLSIYEHGIEKQIIRISLIRNVIICHVDPKAKRMKDELEDYYIAICNLKVV